MVRVTGSAQTDLTLPLREKTCLRGIPPSWPQIGLYNYRRRLEARNFGFRKIVLCSENKDADQLLICAFVFAYAKSRFSHEATHMS